MPCAPLPVLQEGGHAVIGCFPGSTVWGSGGPAPAEVTGGPGGEGGCPSWCGRGSLVTAGLKINIDTCKKLRGKGGKHRTREKLILQTASALEFCQSDRKGK